jgi:tetratricopeptide (TPR) repeat protein
MNHTFVTRTFPAWLLLPLVSALAFQPDKTMLRQMFEESLKRRTQEFGRNDARTAQACRDLGLFLQRNGDTAAARRVLTDTVAIDDATLGKTATQTLEDVSALAAVSPPAAAAPLLARAAESSDATISGPALTSLAGMRKAAGDRAGAAALLRRAVQKAEIVEGKSSPTVALILNMLALVTEPKEAIESLRRALSIDQQALGPRDPQTIREIRQLAALLRQTGKLTEAADLEKSLGR